MPPLTASIHTRACVCTCAGGDPPGIKLRAAKALEAVDYFVPGCVCTHRVRVCSVRGRAGVCVVHAGGRSRAAKCCWPHRQHPLGPTQPTSTRWRPLARAPSHTHKTAAHAIYAGTGSSPSSSSPSATSATTTTTWLPSPMTGACPSPGWSAGTASSRESRTRPSCRCSCRGG